MRSRPPVFTWFLVYCWILAVMYVLVAGAGAALLIFPPEIVALGPTEKLITGIVLLGVGLVFTGVSLVPILVRPAPWLWIYGIVLIALGLTSLCFWPLCIPLLVFWLKRPTQEFLGRPA